VEGSPEALSLAKKKLLRDNAKGKNSPSKPQTKDEMNVR